MALSTERSMAPGEFQTVTPDATRAWSTPSRMVVASKVPPAMVRRRTPSGNPSEKPGTRSGSPAPVTTATSASGKQHRLGAEMFQGGPQSGLVPVAVIGREPDAHVVRNLDVDPSPPCGRRWPAKRVGRGERRFRTGLPLSRSLRDHPPPRRGEGCVMGLS